MYFESRWYFQMLPQFFNALRIFVDSIDLFVCIRHATTIFVQLLILLFTDITPSARQGDRTCPRRPGACVQRTCSTTQMTQCPSRTAPNEARAASRTRTPRCPARAEHCSSCASSQRSQEARNAGCGEPPSWKCARASPARHTEGSKTTSAPESAQGAGAAGPGASTGHSRAPGQGHGKLSSYDY